ncbi:hypothetical protein LQ564_19175 [Massilia sp. G4R7]|uniref:Uncharacterized protein n=1 Tax=Massilia phyllostachyos TaxID=2898585 RepID=A0ABS8Q9K9_9BURK|nr:hypothetical protein [Massilia phyllostachyos]MCD2518427.1 hypothetical protein [Massilia phyllostachyos]
MVWLYRHHAADDIIAFDDATGRWEPAPEEGAPPAGAMTLVQRIGEPLRGSYTIEDGRRYCCYWTAGEELVFREPSGRRFSLFRRDARGRIVDLMPSVSADLIDAVHGDGSPLPNMSTFSLRDCFTPAPLIEVTYDSGKYLLLYSVSLFTYVPDEDLGDWDFFVALRRAIDELKLVARVHALGVDMPPEELAGWGIVAAPTGAACPAPGWYIAAERIALRCRPAAGERLPDIDGDRGLWVWVGAGA